MRRSATLRNLAASERKAVDTCADYLLTYGPFLKYNRYFNQGYPIATGVIEGACRHLVKDRMEITGARWSLEGAEAVLRLRVLHASLFPIIAVMGYAQITQWAIAFRNKRQKGEAR